ncbi:MAG: Sec-independent protein translocase protein TatB [Sulfurimonas sp.]
MFGMGFTEILLIVVMAIIFVGPDKLPSMMVDIAKFLRDVKNTIGTVKDTISEEIDVGDIKKEALAYKEELLRAKEDISQVGNIKGDIATGLSNLNDDLLSMDEETPKVPKAVKNPAEVTFAKKKKKKKNKLNDEVKESTIEQTQPKKEDEIDV